MPYGDPPPYVGRKIFIWASQEGCVSGDCLCIDHVGDMLCGRDSQGDVVWVDTRRIPGFKITDDAPLSSTPRPASMPADPPAASPFVGRELAYMLAVGDGRRHPVRCLGHDGKFLRVRHPRDGSDTYINLDHVALIEVLDDPAAAVPDPIASAVAAFKARPGPLPDTGG